MPAVYVESNFILQIALRQEDAADCGRVLAEVEAGRLDLFVPSFALIRATRSQ